MTITMEYPAYGELRYFTQERPLMWFEEAFFIWVGLQALQGLKLLTISEFSTGI